MPHKTASIHVAVFCGYKLSRDFHQQASECHSRELNILALSNL
jgi:hypothetical protein